MPFIRCPGCQAPLSKHSASCHRCGKSLQPDKGLSLSAVVQVFKTTSSKLIHYRPAEQSGEAGEQADSEKTVPAAPVSEDRHLTERDVKEIIAQRDKQK